MSLDLSPFLFTLSFLGIAALFICSSNLSLKAQPASILKPGDKIVIFIFSDGLKSQFINAKPILDRFGFKATFDVVCNYVGKSDRYMNWTEIEKLHREGYDIGSHSMSHVRLTELPLDSIEYELGKSKQCLADHGIKAKSFEYPFSTGSENKTIVDMVARHYELATRGNDALMFLNCDGFKEHRQNDCKTFSENGTPTYANRYSIRNWSHDYELKQNGYTDKQALQKFVTIVNLQASHNQDGYIKAIPIIMYHGVGDTNSEDSVTNTKLFETEMKYLHDNNFKVLTVSDISYDEKYSHLYIKEAKPAPEMKTFVTTNITSAKVNVTGPSIIHDPLPITQILKQLFGLN